MKNIVLVIGIFLFSMGSAVAQEKQSVKTTPSPTTLLEGTWVVENAALLPTYLKEDYRKFLQAKLIFGSASNNFFGNSEDAKGNIYNYNARAKTLTIFDAAMQGVEYTVKSIEADKLVFSIPNKELNNYIDLVYVRVKEKTK